MEQPNQTNPEPKKTSYKPLIIILIVLLALLGGYVLSRFYFQERAADTNTAVEEKPALIGAAFSYLEGAVEYKAPEGQWLRAELNDNLFLRCGL